MLIDLNLSDANGELVYDVALDLLPKDLPGDITTEVFEKVLHLVFMFYDAFEQEDLQVDATAGIRGNAAAFNLIDSDGGGSLDCHHELDAVLKEAGEHASCGQYDSGEVSLEVPVFTETEEALISKNKVELEIPRNPFLQHKKEEAAAEGVFGIKDLPISRNQEFLDRKLTTALKSFGSCRTRFLR